MVLKKSIYYGRFDGFQAPVVPKAPRSLRRNSHTKSSESSKICAFELLADVAGKLLQESESSTSSTDQERKEQINVPKEFVILEPTNLELKLEPPLKELPHSDNDSCLERVSTITTSDFLKKVDTNVKFEASEGKNVDNPSKPEGYPHGDVCDFNLVNDITEIQTEAVEKQRGELTFREPVESCVNTRVLNKSYSSVHLSIHRGNVKTGIRDDDKKSFRCNHRVTKMMAFRSQSRAGDRKIRKMLTSRYWKVALKKEYEFIETTSGEAKPLYQNRKNVYMRERCQTEAASKRRRLLHHSSKDAYVQKESSESICKSHETGVVEDKRRPHVASNKAGVTSSVISHKGSFHCTDSHVKFSIKSFKVPELYLEVPETATVGSLKRTVMEAVTAILGGELHVGILLEGKKVGDNNITLEQTGISQNCNLETLGFTLEPSFPHDSPSRDNNQQLSRSDMGLSTSLENHIYNNQEILPFQTEISEALVAVSHKPNKKCEFSQRRIRRPFSVSEVEALVEAVETLGTGRWRDVKLHAFDDANHRTYVDLKDKWKTLVHTASISPQQRRGEPVPQDLLDRVLAAHTHWSQNQIKQHRKHQNEPLQISDGSNTKFVGI